MMVKQFPTLIRLRHAKTFLCESLMMYSVLNHLEPTLTYSLNLSWNNVCVGEQLGNHF